MMNHFEYGGRQYKAQSQDDIVTDLQIRTKKGWRTVSLTSAQSIRACNAGAGLLVPEKHWSE